MRHRAGAAAGGGGDPLPNPDCLGALRRGILHFAGKTAMDIDGLGEKMIDQLIDQGLVKEIPDLYRLSEADLMPLERLAEKSAGNLVAAIKGSQTVPWPAWSMPWASATWGRPRPNSWPGTSTAWRTLTAATEEELLHVEGVGPRWPGASGNISRTPATGKLLAKLQEGGVRPLPLRRPPNRAGRRTFVFTGGLARFSRDEAKSRSRPGAAR